METLKKDTQEEIAVKTVRVTGAEAVIKCLLEEGVDLAYGYPGGAIMPVYDEIYKYKDKFHHVLTRHEQGAIHAAQGFARVTGKVGMVFATSGPGATNLVTGIADAQIDSTPLEGIDIDLVNQEFKQVLDGYQCDVALAIGYHHPEKDFNAKLPKSRLGLDSILVRI